MPKAGDGRFFDALGAGDAVEGLVSDPRRQVSRYDRELGAGEIGCFKSHCAALREFVAQSREALDSCS